MGARYISLFIKVFQARILRYFMISAALVWATPTVAQTGDIAGRILHDNVPVAGLVVTVEGVALFGVADSDGDYRIIGVPVGDCRLLTARADGSDSRQVATRGGKEVDYMTDEILGDVPDTFVKFVIIR